MDSDTSQGRLFRVKTVWLVWWLFKGDSAGMYESDHAIVISSIVRLRPQRRAVGPHAGLSKGGVLMKHCPNTQDWYQPLLQWYGSMRKMDSGYASRMIELFPVTSENSLFLHILLKALIKKPSFIHIPWTFRFSEIRLELRPRSLSKKAY